MDMGPAFEKSARADGHATKAIICYDPFHVVQLVTTALDKVRREVWQELRKLPDKDAAHKFKGARRVLLKNPTDLSDEQAVTLRKLRRRGGDLWRAYALKKALRAIFAGDLHQVGGFPEDPRYLFVIHEYLHQERSNQESTTFR